MRTMWHKMSSRLALLLTLTALSGCGGGSVEGNGKNKILYFSMPQNAMSRHLENSILLPAHVTIYPGKLELPKTFSVDLRDTTLDVKVAEGIELLETKLEKPEDGGLMWRIRIRCQTPPGERTELSVRVMDGKRVRYEDAIDISCVEPKKLSVSLPRLYKSDKAASTVLQGGYFKATVRVLGTSSDGRELQLSGTGVEVADPLGPISLAERSIWPDEFVFRADRLGKAPLLKAGPLTEPMPIEVVPNEGWSLRARTDYSLTSGVGFLYFSAQAELADGRIATGLHDECTFTLTPPGREMRLERLSECTGQVTGAPDAGELCVEAFGQKACSTY